MIKNISKLETKIAERTYSLYCDHDSPTEHVKEFCFQLLKYIGQIEDAAKASIEKEKSDQEASKVEETTE